ncbi:MAG: hypothetical protein JWL83_4029 [Actinomycetia bacterium]|nr:hypothetical protein [Actinomycetes bacterium]
MDPRQAVDHGPVVLDVGVVVRAAGVHLPVVAHADELIVEREEAFVRESQIGLTCGAGLDPRPARVSLPPLGSDHQRGALADRETTLHEHVGRGHGGFVGPAHHVSLDVAVEFAPET